MQKTCMNCSTSGCDHKDARQCAIGNRSLWTASDAKPTRDDGWYWVKKEGWGSDFGDWTPALWQQEYRSWSSASFSGIPDSQMIIGEKLQAPNATVKGAA